MAGPAPLLFLGSKPLGLRLLRELADAAGPRLAAVATCDDSADPRGCLPAFREFAAGRGLPLDVLPPNALAAWTARWRPYAVLVCGWYWKIPPAVLALAPGGFLGLHASLLPRYRGNAPLVWALLNGESEAGVSLFRMEEGMDTGDLLAQESFPLGPDDTIADALAKAEEASLKALRAALPGLLAGRPELRPQPAWTGPWPRVPAAPSPFYPASSGTVPAYPRRTPADGHLDWSSPADALHNAIRAQTRPYPGAFAFLEGRKLFIWKSRRAAPDDRAGADPWPVFPPGPGPVTDGGEGIARGSGKDTAVAGALDTGTNDAGHGIRDARDLRPDPRPGRVLGVEAGGVRVACGRGTLFLIEVQAEGAPPAAAADVLAAGDLLA